MKIGKFGYRGVEAHRGKFVAYIERRGIRETLSGEYDSAISAAMAVDREQVKRRGVIGAVANGLNFPESFEEEYREELRARETAAEDSADELDREFRKKAVPTERYPELLRRFLAGETIENVAKALEVHPKTAATAARELVLEHFSQLGICLDPANPKCVRPAE